MSSPFKIAVSLILQMMLVGALCYASSSFANGIVINEIMASNDTTLVDNDGDFVDWLELYNASDSTIDITGYGLSDDPGRPFRWSFPPVAIPSHSFLLVFASDKDRRDPTNELHTNFKIKASGETVTLTRADSTLADRINAGDLNTDVSYGRLPDGSPDWQLLSRATPGVSNDTSRVHPKASAPQFSIGSGFYAAPLHLRMYAQEPGANIYFTLDGSVPDTLSFRYTGAVEFDTTVVVRARTFLPNAEPSTVVNSSYIINETFHFPVVSLTTDPYNLWDLDYGIYSKGRSASSKYPYKGANFWREWERPIYIELFEPDGRVVLAEPGGVRIVGHYSVGAPFKSLGLYARQKYGAGKFRYQIFPDKDIYDFEAFILRNSGNDWHRTLFRDALAHHLASKIGLPVQAYRPAIVFLNGVYWGIHNLRERMNEHYIESNYGVDSEQIDLVAWNYGFQVYAGDSLNYVRFRDYVQSHDLSNPEVYKVARNEIHLNNMIDYFACEIFMGNRDWPHNNLHMWRPREYNGRWMWLFKDLDHGFGYQANYKTNTLRINALDDDFFPHFLENDSFRHAFLNRMAFLMNTLFTPEHVFEQIDQFKSRLHPEIERHLTRWAGVEPFDDPPTTVDEWNAYCQELYEFAENRMPYVQQDFIDHFGLSGVADLNIDTNDPKMGRVYFEDATLPTLPFSGEFFRDIPIRLLAEPQTGYQFVGWQGLDTESDSLTLTLTGDTSITALFKPLNRYAISIVINEINYKSAPRFDVEDWIELANPNEVAIDMSGWVLKDSEVDHEFHFPMGTQMPAQSFLIISRDVEQFRTFFPDIYNVMGDLGFGLSSDGDQVRLYDEHGVLVDSVTYGTSAPWPWKANGNGATLALSYPFAENSGPEQWFASYPNGTPGLPNIRLIQFEFSKFLAFVNDSQTGVRVEWQFAQAPEGRIVLQRNDAAGEWKTIAHPHEILSSPTGYSFVDTEPTAANSDVQYRLWITNEKGEISVSQSIRVSKVRKSQDIQVTLFPNPFNATTRFDFYVPEAGRVKVELYNVRGQRVKVLFNQQVPSGEFHVDWSPEALPSGLYFCRVTTERTEKIFKLTLQK